MRVSAFLSLAAWFAVLPLSAAAQTPTVADALKLKPVQADVRYDQPAPQEVARCSIRAEKQGKLSGWVVRSPEGVILRRFVDTNGDNVVDQWCYYRQGLEVYRDIDSDFNGKADQFRWFHTAGTRWGVDRDGDTRIDRWKRISAEELSREAVLALRDGDLSRFQRLLLAEEDIRTLGIEAPLADQLREKIRRAKEEFVRLSRRRPLAAKAQWLQFAGHQPGLVPEGTPGVTRDLVVYENTLALVEQDGKTLQLHLGTLIQVGDAWRLVSAPQMDTPGAQHAAQTHFFRTSTASARLPGAGGASAGGEYQKLLGRLERLDSQLASAAADRKAALHQQRAELLQQLARTAPAPADRIQWLQQLADTVSVAVQAGEFPAGLSLLEQLSEKLEKGGEEQLAAYVKFRLLTTRYNQQLQDPKADFAKVQARWLEQLKQYVKQYPDSPDTAEALLQLGIAEEFAGNEKEAKQWYAQVVRRFPQAAAAAKAKGAIRRLDSVGKVLQLAGTTVQGRALDLRRYRGRVVLLHYWATWCQPCVQDMKTIAQLYAKYGQRGFVPVGVCLDHSKDEVRRFLSQERILWPQLHEAGGLDGPLANQLGVLTLPTMMLLDRQGRVVNRAIHAGELETELKKYLDRDK